ncbi:DUF3597 domain-containing protein [Rhodobacteraceae bacterium CH30]|nr:DUF3597 domain-containing protein [Rhodobacteraceae bacterium CH30]
MSIFSKIRDAIFVKKAEPTPTPAPTPAPIPTISPTQEAPPAPPAPAAPKSLSEVDVEAVLSALAEKSGQPLNWRTSIVDLMKLLGMESSLAERRELAHELGYTGDSGDTAGMNVWLHKRVMQKLAENGGKVPADLLD